MARRRTKEVASAMPWGPALGFVVVCAVVLQGAASSQPQKDTRPLATRSVDRPKAPTPRVLRNTTVGFRLMYPRSWKVVRQVVATEFAARATCQSVQVVDLRPPPDSGPGAKVLQSFVQLCWRRLSSGESLAGFMNRTYGAEAARLFERTELGGVPAYRTKSGPDTTIFLQTDAHLIQVVASVVAEQAKHTLRRGQVQRILASFSANP